MKARKPSKKAAATGKKSPSRAASKPKAKKAPPARVRAPKAKSVTPPPPVARIRQLPRLLTQIVHGLESKKVENIQVLFVGGVSSITDYLVIGTATSQPHLRAVRVELEKVIDAEKAKILGIDTGQSSGWTVVDAFDVMVHVFTPENREKYRLELLWRDAETIPLSAISPA
jgi:ribosome-associated protein